jgi:hypothetical protein
MQQRVKRSTEKIMKHIYANAQFSVSLFSLFLSPQQLVYYRHMEDRERKSIGQKHDQRQDENVIKRKG